jgi:hypothetical protein
MGPQNVVRDASLQSDRCPYSDDQCCRRAPAEYEAARASEVARAQPLRDCVRDRVREDVRTEAADQPSKWRWILRVLGFGSARRG